MINVSLQVRRAVEQDHDRIANLIYYESNISPPFGLAFPAGVDRFTKLSGCGKRMDILLLP